CSSGRSSSADVSQHQSGPIRPDEQPRERSQLAERRIAHEGIRSPFLRKIAVRTVSGQKNRVVAERPELLRDRIDQLPVVAAREIGAADRALKEDVSDDREL